MHGNPPVQPSASKRPLHQPVSITGGGGRGIAAPACSPALTRLQSCALALLLVLLHCTGVSAQILDPSDPGQPLPGDPDYDASQDRRAGPQEQREAVADTFGIFNYHVDNPNSEQSWRDSFLLGIQRYEPDRKPAFDYATTGQTGAASYPLYYQPSLHNGTEIGLRQYELYHLNGKNLPYYRLERPFTYLGHVRESQQEDSWTTAKFSRNFADGVNLLLDYTRISQQGQQDQYPNQALRNTHVATGLSIRPPGRRYSGYFSFTANTYEHLQNGGILPESLDAPLRDQGNLQDLTSYLDDTRLRHSYREVMATQYLQFGGSPDSLTGANRRAFTLRHQLRYDKQRYRINSRQDAANPDLFFQENFFPQLLIDPRGVRNQIKRTLIENDLSFSTFRKSSTASRETVQRDIIEAGLTHQFNRIDQDGDSTISHLLLHGAIGLRPGDRLQLYVEGQLNLVGQPGDYRIQGQGTLDLGKAGKLELKALNQLYAPDYTQHLYRLNGETIWQNDFDKTLEARVEGAYTLPVVMIRAGLGYSLLTNYIYHDHTGQPQQHSDPLNILQLTAERNFNFGYFRLDNRLLAQRANANIVRLPELYGEHSAYYAGKWFGVLNVNLGIDLRYATGFEPNYYNPILQQFHLQEAQSTKFQYQLDPFFAMRVTRFRFFVKYIQLNTVWAPDDLLYLTALHPYPDAAVRLGVTWRLLD